MYFHRAVATRSQHMYFYGGVLDNGRRSHKLWRYQLPFQVADLSEMCWVKVTALFRDLKRADPQELRESLGIPQRFIDRVQFCDRPSATLL
jgi:hypothetical protein